jgi:hypothetical protein
LIGNVTHTNAAMSKADPMDKSRKEVAAQVRHIVNSCVELSTSVLQKGGAKSIMTTAHTFSKNDRTIANTQQLLKQTAEPLMALKGHYETLVGLDMLAARADSAAAAAARSVGGFSPPPVGDLTADAKASEERMSASIERAAQLEQLARDGQTARAEKAAAEERLRALESEMSQADRDEIEACAATRASSPPCPPKHLRARVDCG